MYLLPKTKIGKVSFWLVISGLLVIVVLNVVAELMQANDRCDANGICYSNVEEGGWVWLTRIIPSLLAMAAICTAGITSIVAIAKYRDRAILLFLSSLLGIMGMLFVLGEIFIEH